ncbi:cytochrome c oxidase assembly protein [Bacillus gobiensis]|uniref:cytochrome c oxidase assembly protein n=1 Tax=Bacillus gobiensis TaxID=1441095 RepID=UPI003D24E122
MNNEHTHPAHSSDQALFEPVLAAAFFLLIALYLIAGIVSNRRYKKWPMHRYLLWIAGIICATASIIGPLAQKAHMDFTAHMIGHLLLGMLAPLLLVLAAPMTLILRAIPIASARRVSQLLKSRPIRILTDPITASVLNIGGLWILYMSDLYTVMHLNAIVHTLVHIHMFFAGYVFTASILLIDPTPHRHNFMYRAIVLIFALAGHSILSKIIYAQPPSGVSREQAEHGAMLMYYGGDVVDLVLIVFLCFQWYRAVKLRSVLSVEKGVD